MNLHIDPVNGLIVAVGLLVGYLVYRRPASTGTPAPTPPPKDLPGGAGAALATILVLAFLFGLGDGTNHPADERVPSLPTASSAPLSGSQPAGR